MQTDFEHYAALLNIVDVLYTTEPPPYDNLGRIHDWLKEKMEEEFNAGYAPKEIYAQRGAITPKELHNLE